MRSSLVRITALGAFALALNACSGGNGTSLPFAGGPNNAGGSQGTIQTGSNGASLLRFVQGSPDSGTGAGFSVDVCVDGLPLTYTNPVVAYGHASSLYAIGGGIAHTVAVYPAITNPAFGGAGSECATAPGPYFGTSPIAVTTITPPVNTRVSVVLGGVAASMTVALYAFSDGAFPVTPASGETFSHNAAPVYTETTPNKSVGFGYIPPGGVSTNLPGAQSVPIAKAAGVSSATINPAIISPLPVQPTSFFVGAGVTSGSVVPVVTLPAPNPGAGQPLVYQLYAIDGSGGAPNLVIVPDSVVGYSF